MDTKSKDFIKLDRRLLRVLGVNDAIVFCHLQGVQTRINKSFNNDDAIYQQLDRISFDTGIPRQAVIKSIKNLEELRLIHKIKHTTGNKNVYKIDNDYLKLLLKQYDTEDTPNIKKNANSRKDLKKVVLKSYNEYLDNEPTSSIKFDTTNKDLIKKELIKKENNKKDNFLTKNSTFKDNQIKLNNACLKAYSKYNLSAFITDRYKESTFYKFLSRFIKEDYTEEDIIKIIEDKQIFILDHLEDFLQAYYNKYHRYHIQVNFSKFIEIVDAISDILFNLESNDWDRCIFMDIIEEYFKSKNRDLTIFLFISKDDLNNYNWIDTILNRLM